MLQYAEGGNWGLSCAALEALEGRPDRSAAIERVELLCEKLAAWPMYFALEFLAEAEPRVAVGAPLVGAKEWWAENAFMPLLFRDYLARREVLGDPVTFGQSLRSAVTSPHATIRMFLRRVQHPFAAALMEELDAAQPRPTTAGALSGVGRFWAELEAFDILVEPDDWISLLAAAQSTLARDPPRSLIVVGEPLIGKSAFLRLLARRVALQGWSIFEASGADLMAGQMYIGQLEGRIRTVVEELDAGRKIVWYVPDLLQLARSGTHQGQSASIFDQILPPITSGRLVIWSEATPESAARLVRLRPAARSLFDTIPLEPLSGEATLSLARRVVGKLADKADIRMDPDCAEVAHGAARQYLGTSGLPGSVLLMIKLTASRCQNRTGAIASREVLETLSQLSGLPVSILDTRETIDLAAIRSFFLARVIGQEEAIDTIVERIAMLKAGLNDPGRPIGVFLFAGPTGTGKTELAKAAAEFLFGSVDRLIRLDMSEFQTPESISKILGNVAAPTEADSLIARVRKQPFSVLLLDEFEKCHPMIWDLFLQAFDEGRLTDAMGQTADLRHCLIILTSNLGATAHQSLGYGFFPQADVFTADQIMRAIGQTFRPEFQNRLDRVIVFRPLTRELMRGILRKELAALLDRRGFKDRAWAIEWEASAL